MKFHNYFIIILITAERNKCISMKLKLMIISQMKFSFNKGSRQNGTLSMTLIATSLETTCLHFPAMKKISAKKQVI